MQSAEIEKLVSGMAEEILQGTDISLVDVEYVREKDWYLRIYIDKPGGIEIDDCQMVSEKLTEILDARDPIRDKYYLEVSSPGIDRPLKKDKDFESFYGKKVDIKFFAPWEKNKEIVAVLTAHDENTISAKPVLKGRESKNQVVFERKTIAMIRPHIDF